MEDAPTLYGADLHNLIVQCSGCKTIIGDTTHFAASSNINGSNVLILQSANDVSMDRIEHRVNINGRRHCYYNVICKGCGSAVGKMFSKVPPENEMLHNVFTFDTVKCVSYRIGSADIRVADHANGAAGLIAGSPTAPPRSDAAPPNNGGALPMEMQGGGMSSGMFEEMMARMETLEAELTTLKGFVFWHDNQLKGLHGHHSTPEYAAKHGAPV